MIIRPYSPDDLDEIVQLFYNTVHTINRQHYSQAQIDAWATGHVDMRKWNSSFMEHTTLVAIENDQLVGFGDISPTGYLDRLYVHMDFQRRGIGTALCRLLEKKVYPNTIEAYVSITANPFFMHRGYQLIQEQSVERDGILMTNFRMIKQNNKKE